MNFFSHKPIHFGKYVEIRSVEFLSFRFFLQVGKYNRAVKRCDDGNKLTTDLVSMINERAELEKTFAKMLKSWSKKWSDYLAKCLSK